MDWNKGFTAEYYACFVDPVTWRDIGRFEITGGSVKRTDSGLRHSADVDCISFDQTTERWIRLYLDTQQAGSTAHEALFTGLATAPQDDINGALQENSLTCYSVLKAAQDVHLPLGYWVAAGVNGAQWVQQLLSAVIPAPVTIIGDSPALSQYIIAEDNENHLSMAEKILAAINWRLRLRGDGTVEITSMPRQASVSFDPLNNDSVRPQLKTVNDWYSCPNVFRAVMDDTSAVARDDSLTSPLSTVNRGREVWMEERDCDLSDVETLAEYAQRRLQEEQWHYLSAEYDHRFHPDLLVSDLVSLHYPEQGLEGLFYVSNQSFSLTYGAEVSEEVIQV